uniref:Cuticle protein 6 n=1 Tax=Bactrocera latifrons TaxID=174628 RepID=A0A0K8UQ84_BACLA
MSAYELSKRVQIRFAVVVVLLLLCLKTHYTEAAPTTDRSFTYAKAQAIKKSGGNPDTSSYFRRDPYGANTYAFGFEVNDNRIGNIQFRDERRYVNGSVEGSFGHVRPDGRVIVTHFLSDNERGFLHETRTFESGDNQQWKAHWPTKRPSILMQRPQDMPTDAVVYDKDLHLNVTNSKVPEPLANALNEQHAIDVNAGTHAEDVMGDLAIQDIIDGKVPLQMKPAKAETHIGFESVHDFLPTNFPIGPFILPPMLGGLGVSGDKAMPKNASSPTGHESKQNQQQIKYNEAKVNNSEKFVNVQELEKSASNKTKVAFSTKAPLLASEAGSAHIATEQPTPLTKVPESAAFVNGIWYQQLIDQSRNEFLSNLPDNS